MSAHVHASKDKCYLAEAEEVSQSPWTDPKVMIKSTTEL